MTACSQLGESHPKEVRALILIDHQVTVRLVLRAVILAILTVLAWPPTLQLIAAVHRKDLVGPLGRLTRVVPVPLGLTTTVAVVLSRLVVVVLVLSVGLVLVVHAMFAQALLKALQLVTAPARPLRVEHRHQVQRVDHMISESDEPAARHKPMMNHPLVEH